MVEEERGQEGVGIGDYRVDQEYSLIDRSVSWFRGYDWSNFLTARMGVDRGGDRCENMVAAETGH